MGGCIYSYPRVVDGGCRTKERGEGWCWCGVGVASKRGVRSSLQGGGDGGWVVLVSFSWLLSAVALLSRWQGRGEGREWGVHCPVRAPRDWLHMIWECATRRCNRQK